MVDCTTIKLPYTCWRRFLGLHHPFPVKAFNIRTQIRFDQASEIGKKKNSFNAYNIWNTRHVQCCCRIICTKQTIHYVGWWYKNVEKIFRKKKSANIYTVHCNSLEPCVSRFAAATAGILANRSHTLCIVWGIWTVKPSANSTGTQHHRGRDRERETGNDDVEWPRRWGEGADLEYSTQAQINIQKVVAVKNIYTGTLDMGNPTMYTS